MITSIIMITIITYSTYLFGLKSRGRIRRKNSKNKTAKLRTTDWIEIVVLNFRLSAHTHTHTI